MLERIKESKLKTSDLINPCESSLCDCMMISIARTFENKNQINIKITRHRFIENGCIREGTSLMNVCWASVLSSFKYSPMMECLKKMFNGEIIYHLKRRPKRLCHYMWEAWHKLLSSLGLKKIWVHFYHPPVIIFERGTKYCYGVPSCVEILGKGTNWKFIFLWRKINWHGLQIAKRHFSYTIWLMISEKSIAAYTFLHHDDAHIYQKSQQTRRTEKIAY